MKNCGRRFHNEVGKFRFLNELIKVVSPKVCQWQFPIFLEVLVSPILLLSLHNQHLRGSEIVRVLSLES